MIRTSKGVGDLEVELALLFSLSLVEPDDDDDEVDGDDDEDDDDSFPDKSSEPGSCPVDPSVSSGSESSSDATTSVYINKVSKLCFMKCE